MRIFGWIIEFIADMYINCKIFALWWYDDKTDEEAKEMHKNSSVLSNNNPERLHL